MTDEPEMKRKRKAAQSKPSPETVAPIAADVPAADAAPASPPRRKRTRKAAPEVDAAASPAPEVGADGTAATPGPEGAAAPRKPRRPRTALHDLDAPAPLAFGLLPEQRLDLPKNDAGNAARLFAVIGDRIFYVIARGWHIAEGGRYRLDPEGLGLELLGSRLPSIVDDEARAAAIRPVSDLEAAAALRDEATKPKPAFTTLEEAPRVIRSRHAAALRDWSVRCGNNRARDGALAAVRPHVVVTLDDLDRDPWLFVCANCVLDLRAAAAFVPPEPGAFLDEADRAAEIARVRASWRRPHDLSSRPTRRSEVRFDPKATAPRFVAFMELIFPDPEVRAYALRLLALLLVGGNEKQIAIFMHGAGGNGKSTLLRVLEFILGEYLAPANIELFLVDRYSSAGKATPEEMNLPGARAITAHEAEARDELSSKKIKAFTGGDRRTARGLGKEQFTYRPGAVPLISTNRIPRIRDDSEGFWRRFRLLPYTVNLRQLPPEQQRDPEEVDAELRDEAPGILNVLLDNLADAFRKDATVPDVVRALVADLREEADPVGEFLRHCTEPTTAPTTVAADLYDAFKVFANDPDGKTRNATAFGRELREKGLEKKKSMGRILYCVRLLPLTDTETPEGGEVDLDPPF